MYLTLSVIQLALNELKKFHPFFGQTFLVFKKGGLPIENLVDFPIAKMEKEFLEKHYKPFSDSYSYFRVLRANQPNKSWNKPTFPSSGSQTTRTKSSFAQALIHEHDSPFWAWNKNYISILQSLLPKNTPVPAFYMAVWLYRSENWPENTLLEHLVERFVREFKLNRYESVLFSRDIPKTLNFELFHSIPISETDLRQLIGSNNQSELDEIQIDAEDILRLLHERMSTNHQDTGLNVSQFSHIERLVEFLPDYDSKYQVISGILFVIRTGCEWSDLPLEFGSWANCKETFYAWLENGTWLIIWQSFFEQLDSEEKLAWTQSFLNGNFAPLRL